MHKLERELLVTARVSPSAHRRAHAGDVCAWAWACVRACVRACLCARKCVCIAIAPQLAKRHFDEEGALVIDRDSQPRSQRHTLERRVRTAVALRPPIRWANITTTVGVCRCGTMRRPWLRWRRSVASMNSSSRNCGMSSRGIAHPAPTTPTHTPTRMHLPPPPPGHASCQNRRRSPPWLQATPTCCSTLRCVAALCAALQHFALRCSTSRCVAARCALLDAALCLQVAPAYGVRRRRR